MTLLYSNSVALVMHAHRESLQQADVTISSKDVMIDVSLE